MRLVSIVVLLITLAGCGVQPQLSGGGWSRDSEQLHAYYQAWKGTPYRLGGTGERGLDCSAFVQNIYADLYGRGIPRTTREQAKKGYKILPGELVPGDLIFFKTGWRTRHVGVYLGNNEFVHASTSVGVTRSSLNNNYWRDLFWQARRVN